MTERLRRSRALLLSTLAALFLILASSQAARAAWRAAGDVKSFERRADGVVLTLTSGARVAVTFTDLETVRVRLAPAGTFERVWNEGTISRDPGPEHRVHDPTPMSVLVEDATGVRVWRPTDRVEMLYPTIDWPSERYFWDVVSHQLQSMQRPYLSLAIRTDPPDSLPTAKLRRLFAALVKHPLAKRLRFVNPVEAKEAIAPAQYS